MLFSRKNKSQAIDLSWLKADMHSHLVPGIDDGSQEMATSLEMIRGLVALGYSKIITTPHILWEMYPNTPEKIQAGIDDLRAAVKEEHLEVEIVGAAEYYIDDHFDKQVREKAPLLTLSENKILVEFSM